MLNCFVMPCKTKYIKLFKNKLLNDVASYNEISLVHDGWHKNTLSFNENKKEGNFQNNLSKTNN